MAFPEFGVARVSIVSLTRSPIELSTMSDDLRTVARYASVAEAAIARNSLDAAGIPAWSRMS